MAQQVAAGRPWAFYTVGVLRDDRVGPLILNEVEGPVSVSWAATKDGVKSEIKSFAWGGVTVCAKGLFYHAFSANLCLNRCGCSHSLSPSHTHTHTSGFS